MTMNILIGIGGTGAKIVESALYLLAAGIGPKEEVRVCLIDQDNSNGNVQRTEALIKLICQIQDELSNGQNRLDWKHQNEAERTALFSIPLRQLLDDGRRAHWRPAPEDLPDLRTILERSNATPAQQSLFDVLFRPADADDHEKEQDLNLAEGYRGRAHVGSAALLSALHHDSPEFLKTMTEHMRNGSAEGGGGVRIMLVGSLFGGTGAAGFPTIARSLHNMRQEDNPNDIRGDKVHIGGVLMLPYFTFDDPEQKANVITTSQLLPQARVALEYYDRLLEQEDVFDHLYIAGWDEMIPLNYHEPGRLAQRNPAMLPELLAAFAVQDFFMAPQIVPKPQPMMAARREQKAFGWTDLPIDPNKRQPVIDRIAQALRFAYVWRYRIDPDLKEGPKTNLVDRALKRPPEFEADIIRNHVKNTAWDSAAQALTQNIRDFSGDLLNWAANLRLYSKVDNLNLWNMGPVVAQIDPKRPQNAVKLQDVRSDSDQREDLKTLVAPTSTLPPAGGAAVYAALLADTRHGESSALGRLIAATYRAARLHHTAETSNVQ
ncbi:MAG: tubulin-like doman-containing protein [Hyphomonadaceae bacterium]|jgi:hypothetical protein|nr:tubulin-like doman-containing protein [Hyphomonadaceae bacterium]